VAAVVVGHARTAGAVLVSGLDPGRVDAYLERLARTRTARALGWLALAVWCVFILVGLVARLGPLAP
jgi:hypothetical protein